MSPGPAAVQRARERSRRPPTEWARGADGRAARRRNKRLALAQAMQTPLEAVPNGAHMEIGTYGDLATMHWVQNEPWAADLLSCSVTYGARATARLPWF